MINKVKLLKVQTYVFTNRAVFLEYIADKKKILVAINAEKILIEDSRLCDIINENIGYPDGVGAVMVLRQKGLDAIKIPGSEFWLDVVGHFFKERSFYLIGSTQEVIDKTVARLKDEFPGINIVGYRNGFVDEEGKDALKDVLAKERPDIVFVAQGTPRQEYLMSELIKAHPALYMGLGGSFDIYSGEKKRAPKCFLDLRLEWLYRLLKEPTRFKRQLALVKFIVLLMLKKI